MHSASDTGAGERPLDSSGLRARRARWIAGLERTRSVVGTASGAVAAAVLIVLALLITGAALGRYTGLAYVRGAHELSGYLQAVLVYGALAAAFARGQFIRVELLIERVRSRRAYALELWNHVVALVVVVVLVVFSWRTVALALERGTRSVGELRVLLYPFQAVVVAGLAVLGLQILVSLLLLVLRGRAGAPSRRRSEAVS